MTKLGICFSGGGGRGAGQIGALFALRELGILQHVIAYSGSSIGAINAVFAGQNLIDKAKDMWFNMTENPLGDIRAGKRHFRKKGFKAFIEGILSLNNLQELLDKHLEFFSKEDKQVFLTVVDSGAASTSGMELFRSAFAHFILRDNRIRYLPVRDVPRDELVTISLASCAFPWLFAPVIKDNRKLRDGGCLDNTPIKPLIDYGCEEIICLRISPIHSLFGHKRKHKNVKIHQIKPKGNLGNLFYFANVHSVKLFKLGYDATINYFKKLEKKRIKYESKQKAKCISELV